MKYFSLLLSLTIVLSLSACNQEKTNTPPQASVSETEKEILNKGIHFGDKKDPFAEVTDSLKPAIDRWLEEGMKNETLNEWGDPFGSLPPTKEQLTDPYTKKLNTKYEWIMRRHGDLIVQWAKEAKAIEEKNKN